MADAERAIDVLGRLKTMGVESSVDDFGTGYASLGYLKRLPVGELKIDRAFVHQMAVDARDAAIVRSTVALAHDLGLTVVAEGVEDGVTWRMLARIGCDAGQGYYLSRPLAAEPFADWLRGRDREVPFAA
jgi:EAL domain-containing protein (putative c-di-GMP-specific phosphodiesterase class I)